MHSLIGQTLGQYRIVEQLGKGGMATVFKAFQPSLERYVAVKVLPPYFVHEEGFSERFVREARAIARLDHPHILPIYDYGQEGETSYIVMKYVDAGTLKDLQNGAPVAPDRALEVIAQVAEALDYAHQQGVIHRDIKPANILMDRRTWVLLSDFGLAKMVEGSQQLTASGVGVGTPAYMAPEQGQGSQIDARADIYSLGIVLYEMLTGRVPYEAETPLAVVLKHLTEPLPLPRLLNPEIPEAVELVVLKALAKDPDDRYQQAGQLAAALKQAVEGNQLPLMPAWKPLPQEPDSTEAAVATSGPIEEPPVILSDAAAETEVEVEVGVPPPHPASEQGEIAAEAHRPGAVPPRAPRVVDATTPAAEGRSASRGRSVPWWGYALLGVLALALISTGIWALTALGKTDTRPSPTPTLLAAETPVPVTPTVMPGSLAESGGLRMGLAIGMGDKGRLGPIGADLSGLAGMPVEVIPAETGEQLVEMVRLGQVDAALMDMAGIIWLQDQGVAVEPILYAQPVFAAVLAVRADSQFARPEDLKGQRVAIVSWDSYAGILERAVLLQQGLDLDRESQIVYLAPRFDAEQARKAMDMVLDGRVQGAIIPDNAVVVAEGRTPGVAEKLRILGESPPTSTGVLVGRSGISADLVSRLRAALDGLDVSAWPVVGLYSSLSASPVPLVEHMAVALRAVGLEARQLVRGEPPAPWEPPELDLPEAKIRVAFVPGTDMSLDENVFYAMIVGGLQGASHDLGLELAYREKLEGRSPTEVAVTLIQEGNQVIVTGGWDDPELVWRLARDHPDVKFVHFGNAHRTPLPNLASFTYRMDQAGFIAGALAGSASERKHVAIVGGMPIPAVEQLIGGFEAGVRQTCPECQASVQFTDSFDDLAAGERVGREVVGGGADVVFNAAGLCGGAAIRAAAREGAWVIGVDRDEYVSTFQEGREPNAGHLLGSVVLSLDKLAYGEVERIARNAWEPGSFAAGVADGVIRFVPAPRAEHPRRAEVDERLREVIRGLEAGEIGP